MITNETLLTDLGGECALSVRALNALLYYDIITVGQLRDFTPGPKKDWLVGRILEETMQVKKLIESELLKGGSDE